MSVIMEISIDHGIIKRLCFETMEQAQIELDKLKPLLGKDPLDRWKNDKEEKDVTHTINAPCGECVIVCHKVSSAGLVDAAKQAEISEDLDDLEIARRKKYKEAKVAFSKGAPPTTHTQELEEAAKG